MRLIQMKSRDIFLKTMKNEKRKEKLKKKEKKKKNGNTMYRNRNT